MNLYISVLIKGRIPTGSVSVMKRKTATKEHNAFYHTDGFKT